MASSMTEVLHEMVFTHPSLPAKAIAEDVGKPYSTLVRELNTDTTDAKVGVDMLIPLMRATGSIAPLEYLASRMGCVVRHVGAEPDGADMVEECLQGFEAVAAYVNAARSGMHYTKLAVLLEKATKEVEDIWVRARNRDEGRQ